MSREPPEDKAAFYEECARRNRELASGMASRLGHTPLMACLPSARTETATVAGHYIRQAERFEALAAEARAAAKR